MQMQTILQHLEDHILMCLEEMEGEVTTDFLMGEKYAYIECLEVMLTMQGVGNEVMLALEAKYGIK